MKKQLITILFASMSINSKEQDWQRERNKEKKRKLKNELRASIKQSMIGITRTTVWVKNTNMMTSFSLRTS